MTMMKASVFKDINHFEVELVEKPQITNPDDVLIKVLVCSICGTDVNMARSLESGDGKPQKRIANSAGFCAYCSITGDEFRQLKAAYPRAFDIMQSHFIDAAVNNKLLNSGPVMDYLLNSINLLGRDSDEANISVVLDESLEGDAE